MTASHNAAAIAAANDPKRNFRSGENAVIRSLSASLKYPYKRTISAPAGNYKYQYQHILLLYKYNKNKNFLCIPKIPNVFSSSTGDAEQQFHAVCEVPAERGAEEDRRGKKYLFVNLHPEQERQKDWKA